MTILRTVRVAAVQATPVILDAEATVEKAVGLLGGSWLCYRWSPPLGVAGLWLASVISLVLAAGMLLPLLRKAMQATESPP
mgnify:CR=1 FL=1